MDTSSAEATEHEGSIFWLALGALGIVYGDIGTSPLYAMREAFHGPHGFPVTDLNVLGVLSLIVWSLILVVSFKYLVVVLQADNEGEGGILALMMLLVPDEESEQGFQGFVIMAMGLFGAALLYGDGMITPAISVMSAIEGLEVATPLFEPYVIPITIVILVILFAFQYRGTGGIGALFGPITLIWFITLGVLGLSEIMVNPAVFQALNPIYAVEFFVHHGFHGMLVLGAVFLVVTGGEALYADLGHFGRKPIQVTWFAVVLPGLLLNYFGQGALLLRNHEAAVNPFYNMAPSWALYPMVVLATAATIIASQAVISGVFSLTMQGVQMGFFPRVNILNTSEEKEGQIYVPSANWMLLLSTVGLVLGFQSSSKLAAAYGVAVSTTMVITTVLLYMVMRRLWNWSNLVAVPLSLFFLFIDMGFFTSMFSKIPSGGWFPLVVAAIIYFIMITWRRGRSELGKQISKQTIELDDFWRRFEEEPPNRPEGTAVYMISDAHGIPPALVYNFEHNQAVHEQVLFLTVDEKSVPVVPPENRFMVEHLKNNFHRIMVYYGFDETPDIPRVMQAVHREDNGIEMDPEEITYVLGRETLLPVKDVGMSRWRGRLFSLMSKNAQRATLFFNLPHDQVIEIGAQIKI
jgi:KUP system potassium uptake protein